MFKDLFISYGRRESLGFVARLHQKLKLAGYEAWFDKVNIPDGEDYSARIKHGIESAHNFVYVMAARALSSPYCLIEIEYARFLGKRLIPINQAVVFAVEAQTLSEADQEVLHQFYRQHQIPDPQLTTTQAVLERSLALVGCTDWLDAKETISAQNCRDLSAWAQYHENQWHKHESLDYLQNLELPQFGETIDSLDSVIERLGLVLARHQAYVSQHTALTLQALEWSRNQALNHYLLVGAERRAAEEWLAVEFKAGEQAPCQPCDLLCDFICESRKNAENRTTDCFICYDYADKPLRNHILKALARHAITTWRHDHDIQRGSQAEQAILAGIAGADNILYFISPNALESEACQAELEHARSLNKRIIPLLIASTPNLPPALQNLQYIKMVDDQIASGIAELLGVLQEDAHYYKQHKILLTRALEWQAGAYKTSFLLRGYNLENAKTWLRLNRQRAEYPPTELHVEFITASEAAKDRLGTEIFLSYSRKDADFARKLNRALQSAGKTVWFDQESISSGANFEVELYKGIQNSDNFLFVISPDSASSPYCESEVNYAVQQGKRIVTLLYRETEQLPKALKFINWIDFSHQDFDSQFPELIQTLELDREHAHQHTVLQQRANEWQDNESSRDFLLNISACEKAEIWLAAASTKQPRATALQKNYITSSRKAIEAAQSRERQRHRKILGSVLIGLVLALALSAFAWNKSEQAKTNNLVNIAHNLIVNADYTRALRVAQAAYAMNIQHPTPEIKQVMSDAYNEAALSVKSTFYQEDLRHSGAVFRALYSPDDKKILTASADGYARLWEIKPTGRGERLNITSLYHGDSVLYTVFSHDGRYFVTLGAHGTVKLWSSEGQEIAFNVANPQSLKRHCAHAEETAEKLECSSNGYFANFSPDSQRLITVMSDNFILLWDMKTHLTTALNTGQMVRKALFSPDGQYIATVAETQAQQIIELRDANNLQLVASMPPAPTNCPANSEDAFCVVNLRFTPQGRLLVTQGNLIRLFNIENNEHHVTLHEAASILNPHQAHFTALFTSSQQEHVSIGDSHGYVYSIDFQQTPQKLSENTREDSAITDLHYSKDGTKLLIATHKGPVSLWFLKENKLLAQYFGHKNVVHTARFSPDERFILTASSDKTVKLWVVEQRLVNPLENLKQVNLVDAVFLPHKDSHILTASQSAVHLWERASKDTIDKYDNSFYKTHEISAVDVSPDGKNFVTSTRDNWIVIRHVELGDVVQQWQHRCVALSESCQIEKVIYSKDGQFLIVGDSQGQINIINIHTKQTVKSLQLAAGIKKLAVAPNNHYLAAITEKGKRSVWKFTGTNFEDAEPELLSLRAVANNVTVSDVVFSVDSHYLASALSDNTARIWNFETAKAINMDDHSAQVNSVHFDPSGNEQLLTGSDDNSIKLWSWSNQQGTETEAKVIGTFKGFDNDVMDAEIGYSGDILAISNDNVYLFPNAQRIYQWLEHNDEIYQLTDEDRRKLGMID